MPIAIKVSRARPACCIVSIVPIHWGRSCDTRLWWRGKWPSPHRELSPCCSFPGDNGGNILSTTSSSEHQFRRHTELPDVPLRTILRRRLRRHLILLERLDDILLDKSTTCLRSGLVCQGAKGSKTLPTFIVTFLVSMTFGYTGSAVEDRPVGRSATA